MPNALKPIQKLIKDGNRREAIQQLKVIINDTPSVEAWYLMALALNDDDNKIKALKRGLKLDPLHTPSNRLLSQLEQVDKKVLSPAPSQPVEMTPKQEKVRQERYAKQQAKKQSRRRRMGCGCLFSMLNGMVISLVVLSIAGMIPGMIATVLRLTSGVEPVTEVNDVPIADTVESLYQIVPVVSKELGEQDLGFIDHGYVSEHTFDLSAGDYQVVFVQFLSLVATNVPNNIMILDSNKNNAMERCTFQPISEDYDNGAAWVCAIDVSGQWALRILGVEGETVGGYVVGKRPVEIEYR